MKLFFRVIPLCFGAAMVALAHAEDVIAAGVADRISVVDPYVRAVPPVVKTTAAFMQFRNSNPTEQFLVEASTPAAGGVELHMHTMDGDVMRMRRIPHIHLPPNETVALEPGAEHIMLFEIAVALEPGDQIPITLTFGDGSTKQISAEVRTVESRMRH
jgi:periplasmic copper chaperone A